MLGTSAPFGALPDEKISDEILPTLTLHPGSWTWMVLLGPFQLRTSYELPKERISPLLGGRERNLLLKIKGRDAQLCPWGRRER